MAHRNEEALELADATLAKLELGEGSLTSIVLASLRLARLMGYVEAEKWFQCELRGYGPSGAAIDNWAPYATWSGRPGTAAPDGTPQYYIAPIEQIESELDLAANEYRNATLATPIPEPTSNQPFGSQSATERVLMKLEVTRRIQAGEIRKWTRILAGLRGSIHDWLSRATISLRYGAIVDNAFWAAKSRFDELLERYAPDAGRALAAAFARASSRESEEWSQALTSCRRALKALADALYPPRDVPVSDHPLGEDEYKNRLIQFATENLTSNSQRDVVEAEIELVARRADALNDLASKGVHASVDAKDLELAVVHTYLLAGELLDLRSEGAPKPSEPIGIDEELPSQQRAAKGSEVGESDNRVISG